jgi:hypothetical protein
MPDKTKLNLVIGNSIQDLKQVRLPGIDKPFEKLTISELVQLRPGSEVADTYDVNAVTDNVSVNTSSMLEELGRIQKIRTMQKVAQQTRLNELRVQIDPGRQLSGPAAPGVTPLSPSQKVSIPEEDVFSSSTEIDPFKA